MKISACIIHRDDPGLARAVASIRPGVDEVVIVDTGSQPEAQEAARLLADRFEVFTDCNDEFGQIANFSLARTRSFDMASHDAVVWVDADDVVRGAEHLREALRLGLEQAGGLAMRAQFPYEYAYSERGECTTVQRRERLIYPKQAFHWIRPVHEGLVAREHDKSMTVQPAVPIVWEHHRDPGKRGRDPERNLRILKAHAKKQGDDVDVKTCFDLGIEFGAIGSHAQAIAWLGRYFAKSEWDDERVLAAMCLIDMLSFWPGSENQAIEWAHRAIDLKPQWGEGYWALAKIAHIQASRYPADERRHLSRVVHYARKGLAQPPTDTQVPTNPVDRAFNIPFLLGNALARLGRTSEAWPALRNCIAARPDDVAFRLQAEEARIASDGDSRLDIVIACGHTHEAWGPYSIDQGGIGGSETAVIEMAKRLVTLGARVRVFCRCDLPGLYDGVEYRAFSDLDAVRGCDVFIAWRNAALLDYTPSKAKWLWVHDTDIFNANAWSLHLTDRIIAVSEWHAAHLRDLHPRHVHKVVASRNGIDLARFEGPAPSRNPHKAIYSSSPDRGLDQLLDFWPRIRALVPDAELHVFYGFANFSPERAKPYLDKLEELAPYGVIARGRVDQATLAAEMLSAGVWIHPSWTGEKAFEETSCIGAMEAQAAGLHVVCGAHGALSETVLVGRRIPGDAREHGVQSQFVDAVVDAMRSANLRRDSIQSAARSVFGWDREAAAWLDEAKRDVRTPPRPIHVRRDTRPVLHCVLAPMASGGVVMDARSPGGEAMGGGSRVGYLGLVREMGKRGEFRVRAFSTFKDDYVERDGVEYIRLDQMRAYEAPDAVFAFYDTSPLVDAAPGVLRIASHHTYTPYMHFDAADVNTAPSQVSMEYLRDRYDVPGSPWYVLPNGCDAPTFERKPVAGRIIYHTSPDRGLMLLLEAYTAIKRRVPHASLHIVGLVREHIAGMLKGHERLKAIGERFERALAAAEALGGVEILGRLPREDLNRELAEASVFAFPCAPIAPCETFSLSIMECCALGLPVVLCPADALESIYAGHVLMVPPPAREAVGPFAEAVVDVLTDETLAADLSARGKALAVQFTFAMEAEVLTGILRDHLPRRSEALAAE